MSGITALTGLQSLQLRGQVSVLPSWLPQLTGLRQLAISELYEAIVEDWTPLLEAAFLPLRQLTCLPLEDPMLEELPQAVEGLPLQRLLLGTWRVAELSAPCAMLGTLRWMGLPWEVSGGMPAVELGRFLTSSAACLVS